MTKINCTKGKRRGCLGCKYSKFDMLGGRYALSCKATVEQLTEEANRK